MRTVTALKAQRRKEGRINIFLDGAFAFSLGTEAAQEAGLREGQKLSQSQVEELSRAELFHRCYDAALRLLSYRPRSEWEMAGRLRRRGFDDQTVAGVLSRLKEEGLVDDAAFAQFWRENREAFSPRSQRLLQWELRQKGVAGEIVDRTAQEVDDNTSAYRVAQKKARTLSWADPQGFRRRLDAYLRRRGFSYEVIRRVVERLWQERPADESPGNSPSP